MMLLPIVRGLARCWLWFYTLALAREIRQDRADDAAAFYADWEADQRAQGSQSGRIGVRLLIGLACGVKDDLAWRWEVDLREVVAARVGAHWLVIQSRWKRLDPWVTRISFAGVAFFSMRGVVAGDYSVLIFYARFGAIGLAIGVVIGCYQMYRERQVNL